MSLFICDGCSESIPARKARLHCQVCPDHDVCANCYVLEVYVGSHDSLHETRLFRISGEVSTVPPPPPEQRPQLPARPTASPQPPPSPNSSAGIAPLRKSVPGPPPGPPPPLEPTPPRPVSIVQPSPQPSPQPRATAAGWQLLYDGPSASPCFVALLNALFAYLDTGKQGMLTPEQYTGFLEAQGYTLDQHVWKKNLQSTFAFNKEDIADFELRTTYDNFSFEYRLKPRNQAPNTDFSQLTSSFTGLMGSAIGQAVQPPPISGGMMPCLTLTGFIDITIVETFADPGAGWMQLNRALQAYGIWRQWGDVPRNMLPEFPPQSLLDRVKRVSEFARQKAQNQLAAKKAELALKQQGQQAALDLIDGPRYYYRY